MKNTITWLCLLCTIHLSAQDRILTLKQDTLKAKVNSIDKLKIIYYLESDKDKLLQELPIADLHKIIWRNGLEYIINQEFDDRQKRLVSNKSETKPVATPKPIDEKPEIEEVKQEIIFAQTPQNAPKLRVRRWVLWRTYTADGKRVGRNITQSLMSENDFESYQDFRNGNDTWKQGRRLRWLAYIPYSAAFCLAIYVPVLPELLLLGSFGMSLVGDIKMMKANKIMREAVLAYEEKRIANKLKPSKFTKNKF